MTASLPKHPQTRAKSTTLGVGWFLANRYIRRTTPWTTLLIIFVMTLTFLNLVVVSGILVGLIQGVNVGYRHQYSGEVIISSPPTRSYIEHTAEIVAIAKATPQIKDLTVRYLASGQVEANYRNRRHANDLPDRVGAVIAGIDPEQEDKTTGIGKYIIDGEYLSPTDEGEVIIGSSLLQEYALGEPVSNTLEGVKVGDRIRITLGEVTREVRIKGILKSKIDLVTRRIYFTDREFRKITERTNLEANEIALFGQEGVDPTFIKKIFVDSGFEKDALIQTYVEAQPSFVKDITATFDTLGSIIGAIGLVASSVTIFIVIFVNAVTRRKYIGILQGIGIETRSIEIAYLFQALFYAFCGILLGLLILYGFMKPYLDVHPIDFPFSDGILYVEPAGVIARIVVLLVATIIAGFVPARLVTRGNILDSILGR